ncbi:MAG: M48 family metalloprotease [archaeon]|nr:M48 family metalloprotease [archaeon]MCR4323529.1 M48 family metalloprotease [Nanoarchaeota archaeon]
MERVSFYDEIARNKRNSFFLLTFVFIVLLLLTYVIGLAVGGDYFFIILVFGTIISILYVVGGYYNSHKLAIASVSGKLADGSQYHQYHNIVEGLSLASGVPKPKLYVMNNPQINAFASGRNPENAVICVTTGALENLSKQELEGVLAHEMSHIANYDIRFMTLTAILVGMISIIAQIFLRSLWYGGGRGSSNDKDGAIWMVVGIALAILAPIVVALVQLAISRKREYAADSSAVKFMRTPTGLINALKKIGGNKPMKVSGAVAPLFIANPSKTKELFMTHPPLEKRIARLERM